MLKYLIPIGIGAGIAFAVWKFSKSTTSDVSASNGRIRGGESWAGAPDITGPMRAAGIQRLLLPGAM